MDPFDVAGWLDQPLLCASVAAVSKSGSPLLGVLWYKYEDGRLWFTTQRKHALARAIPLEGAEAAVAVELFDPPEHIEMVRISGTGREERWDEPLVTRMYSRYLTADLDTWPAGTWRERLADGLDGKYMLWTITADRGFALRYPNFGEAVELRWRSRRRGRSKLPRVRSAQRPDSSTALRRRPRAAVTLLLEVVAGDLVLLDLSADNS